MEPRSAVGVAEIRCLEIECPHCHALTCIPVELTTWTRKGNSPLGEHGLSLCIWCGRNWPDGFGGAILQIREGFAASRKKGLPVLRIVA